MPLRADGLQRPTAEPPAPSPLPRGKQVRAVPCRYFSCEKFFSLRALIPTRFLIFHPRALLALRACPCYRLRPSSSPGRSRGRGPLCLGTVGPFPQLPRAACSCLLRSLPGGNEGSSLALLGEGSGTGCRTGSILKARGDLLHPDLARQGRWHLGSWCPAAREGPVLPPDQETAF